MIKVFSFFFLLLPLCTFAQTINLGTSKDLGWAVWTYETLEFRDDCTILKGYFVPSGSGCWVISKMDETLKTEGKEYRIIYTTLPTNQHPRTTYNGGVKVYFEEHYEPIFSTGRQVHLTSHDISFSVPFNNRKVTKPYKDLLPEYEGHIDTLISQGKYGIAAYLLYQYAKKACHSFTPKEKKKISKKIFSKYRVSNFFLNAEPGEESLICSQFERVYLWFGYNEENRILNQLDEINRLQFCIGFNMNWKHLSNVIEWCESLMPMIRYFGKYNKCYEYVLSQYRKALIMDGQKQKIPELDNEIIDVCSHIYDTNAGQYLEHLMNIASDLDVSPSNRSYDTNYSINIWREIRDKAKISFPNSWRYASALIEIAKYNYHNQQFDVALMQYLTIDSLCKARRNEWISEVWYNHDFLSAEQSETYVNLIQWSLPQAIGRCSYQKGDIVTAIKYDEKNPY